MRSSPLYPPAASSEIHIPSLKEHRYGIETLCWLLRTSVGTIGRLPLWDPSLGALAVLKRGKCRAIERRHSCLTFLLVSGHLQAEWTLISHLHEPLSCTNAPRSQHRVSDGEAALMLSLPF